MLAQQQQPQSKGPQQTPTGGQVLREQMTINNISSIAPNGEDQSVQYLLDFDDRSNAESLFGTGNIGPDRIRLSMAKRRQP